MGILQPTIEREAIEREAIEREARGQAQARARFIRAMALLTDVP